MPFRKLLLRIVFISLAGAAVFGAAGVLLASHDVSWRVAGTCIATAVAALLMLWVAHHLEKDPNGLTGALAAALIALEYILLLLIIWELIPSTGMWREEQLGATMLVLAADAVPAILFVHWLKRPITMVMARVGIVLCIVDFVLFMASVYSNRKWWSEDHLFDLGAALAAYGSLAVMALVGAGTDKRHWRWLGVLASAAAMAIASYAILKEIHGDSVTFVTIISIAAVAAHANLMMLCPLKPNQQWLRWGTIGSAVLTGIFIDALTATNVYSTGNEFLERLSGASAILAGCGTLAMLVLAKLNRKLEVRSSTGGISELREVALTCPLCGKKQTLNIGEAQCAGCGLVIAIRLNDPKCRACGYSLLMLKSDRCPECGTATASGPAIEPEASA